MLECALSISSDNNCYFLQGIPQQEASNQGCKSIWKARISYILDTWYLKFKRSMWLCFDIVPLSKNLLAGTLPLNKKSFVGTTKFNKTLFYYWFSLSKKVKTDFTEKIFEQKEFLKSLNVGQIRVNKYFSLRDQFLNNWDTFKEMWVMDTEVLFQHWVITQPTELDGIVSHYCQVRKSLLRQVKIFDTNHLIGALNEEVSLNLNGFKSIPASPKSSKSCQLNVNFEENWLAFLLH